MATVSEITDRIERDIRTIDREIDGFISILLMLMQNRVLKELSALPDGQLGKRDALRLLGGMESIILEDQEVLSHIQSLEELFMLQESMMSDLYRLANDGKSPPKSGEVPRNTLAVFIASRLQNVEVMVRAYANEVRQRIADTIISQEPISDFNIVETPNERILGALSNDLKTATATHSRMIAMQQASKLVLYAGPRDARNRPFCAERVNKIYPLEVVYTWDNGQGLPAHLYCGGYGCRHILIPVNKGA